MNRAERRERRNKKIKLWMGRLSYRSAIFEWTQKQLHDGAAIRAKKPRDCSCLMCKRYGGFKLQRSSHDEREMIRDNDYDHDKEVRQDSLDEMNEYDNEEDDELIYTNHARFYPEDFEDEEE